VLVQVLILAPRTQLVSKTLSSSLCVFCCRKPHAHKANDEIDYGFMKEIKYNILIKLVWKILTTFSAHGSILLTNKFLSRKL
jgi:hypothetical protein